MNNRQYYKQAISSEDYSFVAHADGKYVYCFSNEGWTSNSKEVSFNVHGIVYVPESEMPQDPLEVEGMDENTTYARDALAANRFPLNSSSSFGGVGPG